MTINEEKLSFTTFKIRAYQHDDDPKNFAYIELNPVAALSIADAMLHEGLKADETIEECMANSMLSLFEKIEEKFVILAVVT